MDAHKKIVLLLFVVLLPIELRAQQADSQPTDDLASSPPSALDGRGPILAFRSEKVRVNYLSAGIDFTGAFSDNALLSNTAPISDFSYLVQPHLALSLSTPRVVWNFILGAGLIVNQRLNQNNRAAKDLGLDLNYRLSENVNLRLSDTFTDTSGLFSGFTPGTSGSGIGVIGQPTNSLLIPFNQRTQNNASLAELRYQFSPSSVAGVRGTFSIVDYPGSATNTQFGPLYNDHAYSGEAFYDHQISAKQWVGVTFQAQKFEVLPSIGTTNTASWLLNYTVKPIPTIALSFFAGPTHLDARQVSAVGTTGLFRDHRWTSAEGATFDWQSGHTSAAASFSRQLSGGGGLSSGVGLQTLVDARLRRQLDSRQEVNCGFTYTENGLLVSGQSFQRYSGLLEFQQRLANSLVVRIGYARDHQEFPGIQSAANANRTWVTVSYNFDHSFGR